MPFLNKKTKNTLPITPVTNADFKGWLKSQDKYVQSILKAQDFQGKDGQVAVISDTDGKMTRIIAGVSATDNLYKFSHLPSKLPKNKAGYFIDDKMNKEDATQAAIGWALGAFDPITYKTDAKPITTQLSLPTNADKAYVDAISNGTKTIRDLINIPTNDMGPNELEKAAKKLIKQFNGAGCKVIKGDALLKQNFPLIHAVGRASPDEPRLLDITWGKKSNPTVTLVGKGVCYDTGGLNIKPGGAMALMKKDMGGAAHVLGLAEMIMALDLPIRLRVLVPTVENSIAGNAYRPGDVLPSRQGHTVEIDNTDAEGRLVLADALTLASEEKPDLLIDFATLTGAARVALGPELPAMFTNNDNMAHDLISAGANVGDPMWMLPLWDNYFSYLNSDIADFKNSGGGMAGATTAALFLQKFVGDDIDWVHIDTYGWNPSAKSGRPKGGAAYGAHASLAFIQQKFGTKKPKSKAPKKK
ncbi:MAG: leucyl aminopeptidase family protein [Gammaproteobacteria bacterium]|nr:leucyl aminopeptidase family protein [Gammaproteobacteria bacterium]